MTTIVDASVAVKWVVEEEGSAEAAAIAEHDLRAPELLLTECANALWAKARRGELTGDQVRERVAALQAAPLFFVSQAELIAEAVDLALEIGHPVYDCLYLALAIRDDAVLVTADGRLLRIVRSHRRLRPFVTPLIGS